MNLVGLLFATGSKLLRTLPMQQLFKDLDVIVAAFDRLAVMLNLSLFINQFLLQISHNRQ